jgi:hypothetical protein
MANLGEVTELVNASEYHLLVGANTYIMLQELDFNITHSERAEPTVDGGVQYFYGPQDASFTFTILATSPEITTLVNLTQADTESDLTSTAWIIKLTDSAGTSTQMTVNGVLPTLNLVKELSPAGAKFRGTVRITDNTITVV